MTKEEMARFIKAREKYPHAGRKILTRVSGLTEKQVRIALHKGMSKSADNPGASLRKSKTLADFRTTYDKATIVPAKVRTAIKELGAGGWEYEVQFARQAGVNLVDLAMFREMFADYIVNLKDNKRAWAGSAKTAKIMREMI